MSKSRRPLALLAVGCALLALAASALGAKPKKGKADSGTAYASITHVVGSIQIADGDYIDKILGDGVISYRIALLPGPNGTFHVSTKKVTLYTGTGSLSGTATATVALSGTTETITNGKLSLTKGAGSLKGHSFVGTFTGTGDLSKNLLVFHDKGTYK